MRPSCGANISMRLLQCVEVSVHGAEVSARCDRDLTNSVWPALSRHDSDRSLAVRQDGSQPPRRRVDGAPVKPLPKEVADLARVAVAEAYGRDSAEAATYAPDAAIVNLYAPGAHLGLHQDGEEPSDAPVVTLSLGDSCIFRFAGVGRRTGPFMDLELRSGDLLVFGEPNRRIYHGVPKVLGGTAPGGLGLPPGRLSITVRETGL